jgi:hypothetical protein
MLKDLISTLFGLVGIILLSYGTYLIAPHYGFITLGLALTFFSFLMARANAVNKFNNKKNKKQ